MKTFNKLVRDRIPEIIMAQNKSVTTHMITDYNEKINMLIGKLDEEVAELKEAYSELLSNKDKSILFEKTDHVVEEMADVEEVLAALCYHTKIDNMQGRVNTEKDTKCKERGGFKRMIYLETSNEE